MGIFFTPQQLKGLKASKKRQEIRDLGGENLFVVVQPHTGNVSFVIRVMLDGTQRKKTIGSYPAITLAEARDMAREIKVALKRGEPLPVQIGPPNVDTATSVEVTVNEAWDLYWKYEAGARRSAREKQRIFERDVRPAIGDVLLKDVTRTQVAGLVKAKFETAPTASNRLHSLLSRFFRWCLTKGEAYTRLSANPMATVVKIYSERDATRTRYLTHQEITYWSKALDAAGEYAPIHELLMRTLCRFSDILHLTWGEVRTHDNGDDILVLDRTKNGQSHVVWLHPSAAALLPSRPVSAQPSQRVFKPVSYSGKPIASLRKRMSELAAAEGVTVPHWRPHDYRRTGTTHLASMLDENDNPRVPHHILDRLLSHKEHRVIRHYNNHAYYKEKKRALMLWNELINDLSN